ncbi:fosfomycin resistance glutathione transferase [Janthinobacterium sp. CG_23.3]|uniref:fosfomycin resistance glutathione transferase n=1 Tax=Janthinobacterium sp. CG_23.3 TaxID=3349634 RepID=UPI0038D4AE59
MLTGINHLTLAVTDISKSVEFYSRLLNFRLHASWDAGAYLSVGELWLCLSLDTVRSGENSHEYTHYAFSIQQSELPQFRQRLEVEGIKEWKLNRSEGDSVYFLDPDGHKLEAHVGSMDSRIAQCRKLPYTGMQFYD